MYYQKKDLLVKLLIIVLLLEITFFFKQVKQLFCLKETKIQNKLI